MQTRRFLQCMVVAAVFVAGFISPALAQQTFVVDSVADEVDNDPGDGLCGSVNGRCTLRAAIQEANALLGADQILVPIAGTYTLTIPGASEDAGATGDLDITEALTISGLTPATTIVDAAGLDRVFHVLAGTVQIQSLTIRGGVAPFGEYGGGVLTVDATTTLASVVVRNNTTDGFMEGGGIANDGALGSVFVFASSLIDNTAGCGGGLFNTGLLAQLESTTVSGNAVSCTGGGLFEYGSTGQSIVANSTFVANLPNNIAADQDTLHLSNTLMVPAAGLFNCDILLGSGTIDDGGNFAGTDACDTIPVTPNAHLVQGLTLDADSGQYVHRPLVPNPAIDGGNATVCANLLMPFDQRGVARPQGMACDSGAVELKPVGLAGGAPIPATWSVPYVHTLSGIGEGALSFSLVSGTLPTGLWLSAGTISGTPSTLGLSNFTIRVTDETGQTADQATSITVAGIAASIAGTPPPATWSTAYNFTFTGAGNGSLIYALTSGALPAGLVLTSTGTLIGTPTALGTAAFTVTLIDATAQVSSLATSITVTGTPAAISGTPGAATRGTAYSFAFTGTGNGALTYALTGGALPAGLALTSAGTIIGTPTTAGTFPFTVTLFDATVQTSSLATSITVSNTGAPTVTGLTNVTVEENRAIPPMTLTVADDVTSPAQLTVSVATSGDPILSDASISGSGSTRTLQLTLAEDREGVATVTVTVSDGTSTATATALVTATPAPVPDPPTGLTAAWDGSGVVFSWHAPAAGAVPTFFVLEGGTASGLVTVPIVNTGRATSVRTVVPAGTWHFRVRSGNSAGTSVPSAEIAGAIGDGVTSPGAPQGLAASVNGTMAGLTWHRPTEGGAVTAWQVEVGTAPGLSDLGVFQLPASTLSVGGSLAPGAYAARVRAIGPAGAGPASNETSFTVGAVTPCGAAIPDAPVLLPATVANRLVTLTWRPPTNSAVANYRLLVGSAPGLGDIVVADLGAVTSLAVTAPPGQFHITMLATNACGTSAPSNPILVVVQ